MNKIRLWTIICILTLLTGCSLAQPERISAREHEDSFVGFYVVFGRTEHPTQPLFAQFDEQLCRWVFDGLDGYCAFVTNRDDIATGTDGLQGDLNIEYTNGNCTALSGSIYIEQSDKEYFAICYDVYETNDGRIYIDGTGSSMSNSSKRDSAMGSKVEKQYNENGEAVDSYEFEVKVDFKCVIPTKSLTLVQFDAEDVEISRENISLKQQTIALEEDTAWMMVIETDREGSLHHTTYEPPVDQDDYVSHNFYLLQENGSVQVSNLAFDNID